ncbi:uncharacterized protein MEPE_00916 [Melanopsichium pennsylvanicum]|uniref:Uncharacterized protein n=2 Tax=Melanopsichium pennsylvanicum TaxID=63383 RepID=A0AAJ4XHH5_9BASI|nr:putative protein [Melanopsichium pennsylvanicum 4]SNX82210.1 uncharacterized protein MEPE_00916 [Melanopsichium pennsylvanicum]
MSHMPARTLSEAVTSQQDHPQHRNTSHVWSSHANTTSTTAAAVADSKRLAAAGPSSPKSPLKRPWNSPAARAPLVTDKDSAEEDELSDETSQPLRDSHHRMALSKRKDGKMGFGAPSPKRSKRVNTEHSSSSKIHDNPQSTKPQSRSPSPQSRTSASERTEGSTTGSKSEQSMSPDEIDTFLDLVYKHHPYPMTAENMRKSVDALYADWERYCAHRQIPVRLDKKPLMDEYHKIFNGIYGTEYQAKARAIAQELSQRAGNSAMRANDEKGAQRRDSYSRRSLTRSLTDGDSEDEEAGHGDETMAGDIDAAGASSLAPKMKTQAGQGGADEIEPESSRQSNIAQVGRNGLAVLPPGLFDILRNHLRDDILSSIMPSVRNDLTEQTRELFLQNQDLFGRIKEMEDRIRNQDLWIRHLLSRDPTDMTTPPVGPHMGAGGELGSGPKARPFATFGANAGRPPRYGAPSESDMGSVVPAGDFFTGPGPISPRQPPRNEQRHFPQQGMAGPHPGEVRSPPFGSGRWEADGPPPFGAHRDHPPLERRPSYQDDAVRRPGSWQGEPHPARGFRAPNHPGDRPDMSESRYEPPLGSQPSDRRMSFAERRRLSALSGGAGGQRGSVPAPPAITTGTAPLMSGGMQDEFRRPAPPMHPREPVMSPISPAYDTRRSHAGPHSGLPVSHSEPFSGVFESNKAPLPPRAAAVGSSEQMQKNKRGRPSKAELANSRADLEPAGRASFSGNLHAVEQRPYLS